MDNITRCYLYDLASLRLLPAPLAWTLGPVHRFMVAGFLPPAFRAELGLAWSPARRRFHDRLARLAMAASRVSPAPIRRFPINLYLWDTRRRIRAAKPIV